MGVKRISLFLANILLPVAVVLFAGGLFMAQPPSTIIPYAYKNKTSAPFDKVVFMVIDALRSDFVYSNHSGFEFTQSLIRSGSAVPFTARASPPSLTISRIKAMTIGSNPSFLDVILNIADDNDASDLSNEDTWLSRLKATLRGKLVFYGENTWLQLYPDVFDRSEGASAFFVPDFTEIDNNIKVHVTPQLRLQDWSALVFHFPGMDHVGHTGGPTSPHMLPKQREMDLIIQEIYEAIDSQPHLHSTLFVVAGDHGMNQQGNHGGSSAGETSPGMLLISPRFNSLSTDRIAPATPHNREFDFYSVVQQPDIVPTLAGLLGFPIPTKSVGIFMPQFLPLWEDSAEGSQLLLENAHQLLNLRGSKTDPTSNAALERIESRLFIDPNSTEVMRDLYRLCDKIQSAMATTTVNPNFRLLFAGLFSAFLASILPYIRSSHTKPGLIQAFLPVAYIAFYTMAMMNENYVKQEDKFWYPVSLLWLGYLGYSSNWGTGISGHVMPVLLQFLVISWTQSGDATHFLPQLIQTFISHYPILLWILMGWTYITVSARLNRSLASVSSVTIPRKLLTTTLGILSLSFKFGSATLNNPDLVSFATSRALGWVREVNLALTARLILSVCGGMLVFFLIQGHRHKRISSKVLNFRMTKFSFQLLVSKSQNLSVSQVTLTTIILSQASFFAFGGSNTIASIDLTNGFNGVEAYNSIAVVLQTLFANWAGPTWWACGGIRILCVVNQPDPPCTPSPRKLAKEAMSITDDGSFDFYMAIQTTFVALGLAAVMVACLVVHDTAIMWTFLAPKYIFASLWVIFYHLIVTAGLFGMIGKVTAVAG
ncbi:hypothetical protein N7532_004571 [Penicillium argentinense]|uniref:GPI ethanolamine phosphate transferase 2 n=1 Tax=Penicillium argentinense TaxID=1131581 RepID=A0A9W9KG99_9EURO|nr:uncharacterized protein N7532_004571 [Penicillium argentinense]KAJ5104042.1 hypothetical protein N7532_004571 [Penicillium argentinense]